MSYKLKFCFSLACLACDQSLLCSPWWRQLTLSFQAPFVDLGLQEARIAGAWQSFLGKFVTQISLFSPVFTAHYKCKTTYLKYDCGLLHCQLLRKSSVFWALADVTWSVAPFHKISSWCHSVWSWHQQWPLQQPVSSSSCWQNYKKLITRPRNGVFWNFPCWVYSFAWLFWGMF